MQDEGLVWLFALSHLGIFIAYVAMPALVIRFLRKQGIPYRDYRAFWLTAGFIFTCGITHGMSIWTLLVRPDYWTEAVLLLITALISLATLYYLPGALRYIGGFKEMDHYRKANHELINQMTKLNMQLEVLSQDKEKQSEEVASLRRLMEYSTELSTRERQQVMDKVGETFGPLNETIERVQRLVGKIERLQQ